MKTYISTLSIVLVSFLYINLSAQNNWTAYSSYVPIDEYQGLPFRLSASIYTELAHDNASARLFTKINLDEGIGFYENMWDNPIQNDDWGTYTIEGIIDKGAIDIDFGIIVQYNGSFYFDDIKLEVKDKNEGWKEIYYDNFEPDTSNQRIKTYHENKYFSAQRVASSKDNSTYHFRILGKEVPIYGMNNEVGKYAAVNDIQLYYEIYGEGQPLIVLHGNGGSIADATLQYPSFIEKGYQIIAVDSRAQGKSGDSDKELTYDLLMSDIYKLLVFLDIDSAYVWGQSDGAILSLLLAINHPEKVHKIIAFAPNLRADTNALEPILYDWIKREASSGRTEQAQKLGRLMRDYPNIPIDDLHKIKSEILLMCGDRDGIHLSHMIEMFENIPKSQLCVIPGATHSAAWDKNELFMQIAIDFFEKPFSMPSTIEYF